jgi:uncharacterized phage protein (TIGR01671 family)
MKRNFEFRFWCLGTSDNANFNKKGWWSYPNFLLSKYHGHLDIFDSPHFVACQFTGLHDKNGEKIFEGDILRSPEGFIRKVIWHEGDCGWRLQEKSGNVTTSFKGWVFNNTICGNIFENPELL